MALCHTLPVLLYLISCISSLFFFFFNDPATTEIYTLSLHDALPICLGENAALAADLVQAHARVHHRGQALDRKSTRLNSSHTVISYAVFCLKKKKKSYTPIYSISSTRVRWTRSFRVRSLSYILSGND